MNRFLGTFFHWLPVGVVISGLGVALLATVNHLYRQPLNDPQVQMAEDGARALADGRVPADIVSRGALIDADKSLAPFIAVYDKNGTPLEASATVGGLPPKPPIGVFNYAKLHGENRVTWQPSPSTRIALIVRPVPNSSGWFVAAGRNMREGERRKADLSLKIAFGVAILLFVSFVIDAAGVIKFPKP